MVNLRITISLIVLAALIVGGYTAYRRYIASMQVGSEAQPELLLFGGEHNDGKQVRGRAGILLAPKPLH